MVEIPEDVRWLEVEVAIKADPQIQTEQKADRAWHIVHRPCGREASEVKKRFDNNIIIDEIEMWHSYQKD